MNPFYKILIGSLAAISALYTPISTSNGNFLQREYNDCVAETGKSIRVEETRNEDGSLEWRVIGDEQWDDGCPFRYNECTGPNLSRAVRRNPEQSYDVLISSQEDANCPNNQ